MTAHTPARWHTAVDSDSGARLVLDENNYLICKVSPQYGGKDETHAALIAAAPETAAERDRLLIINAKLLAALKGMMGLTRTKEDFDRASAAIAKAQP